MPAGDLTRAWVSGEAAKPHGWQLMGVVIGPVAEAAVAIAVGLGMLLFSKPFSALLVEANEQTWIRPKVPPQAVRIIILVVGLGFVLSGIALLLTR